MRQFRFVKILTFSTFFFQAGVLFILIFVSDESQISAFYVKIPDDLFALLMIFTYCYPIAVGFFGLFYFSRKRAELESYGVRVKTYLLISKVNFTSAVWAYVLAFLVFICFMKFRFPL